MPSAQDWKKDGNTAFAAKKFLKSTKSYTKAIELEKDKEARAALFSNRSAAYMGLQQYDKALTDANAALAHRPEWDKAYARLAECYCRLQDFSSGELAYRSAIRTAEDPAAKARYETALKTTSAAAKHSRDTNKAPSGARMLTRGKEEDHFHYKLEKLVQEEGYVIQPNGGLSLSCAAYATCVQGMQRLDETHLEQRPDGMLVGHTTSQAIPDICEALLLDESVFVIPYGSKPGYPLAKKMSDVLIFQLRACGGEKYFHNRIWDPKEVIEDLDKRVTAEEDGRENVRRLCSQLVRGRIVTAFAQSAQGDLGGAVAQCKFAIGILEEGNKKWRNVPYEDKSNIFKPTFVRLIRVYLLKCLLSASRDAKTVAAKRMFKLEDVEKLAQQIIEENPPSAWPAYDGSITQLAYHRMPHWEAHAALGYVTSSRAREAFADRQKGKPVFADRELALKAAEAYDACVALLPDDWHEKRIYMLYAIEMYALSLPFSPSHRTPSPLLLASPFHHPRLLSKVRVLAPSFRRHLRAGGLKIKEVFERFEAAERVEAFLSRLFTPLKDDFEPLKLARMTTSTLKQMLASSSGRSDLSAADTPNPEWRLKPVPMLVTRGMPASWNPHSAVTQEEWESRPGDLGIVDFFM